MDSKLRRELIQLWQKILKTEPEKLFGDLNELLQNRNWGDRIPQPGYVGKLYAKGGVVFVGMNPGGGPNDGLSERDIELYRGLENLRESDVRNSAKQFELVNSLLASSIPTYKYARTYVVPVLQGSGMHMTDVAYLNLLKWRTRSKTSVANLNKLYDRSWYDHTGKQIELLAPRLVVAVGSDAGRAFKRHTAEVPTVEVIPRVIGNNIDSRGKEVIKRIVEGVRNSKP